jgi:hypothetical protein
MTEQANNESLDEIAWIDEQADSEPVDEPVLINEPADEDAYISRMTAMSERADKEYEERKASIQRMYSREIDMAFYWGMGPGYETAKKHGCGNFGELLENAQKHYENEMAWANRNYTVQIA